MKKAEEFRKDLIQRTTTAEKKFRSYLDRNNIKYLFQKIIYIRDKYGNIIKFFIADFYLPSYKLIVEIDGEYHNSKEQKELDINRELTIKRNYPNIRILRIENCKTGNYNFLDGLLEAYKNEF